MLILIAPSFISQMIVAGGGSILHAALGSVIRTFLIIFSAMITASTVPFHAAAPRRTVLQECAARKAQSEDGIRVACAVSVRDQRSRHAS